MIWTLGTIVVVDSVVVVFVVSILICKYQKIFSNKFVQLPLVVVVVVVTVVVVVVRGVVTTIPTVVNY